MLRLIISDEKLLYFDEYYYKVIHLLFIIAFYTALCSTLQWRGGHPKAQLETR